ncbi:UNKNOWN [Stylonychia lemnae]|uniref:Uncharacterized protein n=1 Tax=Stylonychia lemnae TaxID=5949 RepID=A0A077ZS61_STYLE|nr:UNKNOWN [Stylonychia lemnae]|eukprot:CDW72717.1 UNKNOWN [Stylonychia lemnae]
MARNPDRRAFNWENMKCCGKKRMNSSRETEFQRESITRRQGIIANGGGLLSQYSQPGLGINQQHGNQDFIFDRPSITSNMSLRREQDYANGYKRPRHEFSHNSFKSNQTAQNLQRPDNQLFGSLQQYDKLRSTAVFNNSQEQKSRSHSLISNEDKQREFNASKQKQQDEISQIDEIIKNKQIEIEQLQQLKEQHLLQTQVNQVVISQPLRLNQQDNANNSRIQNSTNSSSFIKSDYVRINTQNYEQADTFKEKPLFGMSNSGLFSQPYSRQQIFNTSKSTINPVNTNMNTSFDTTMSRANNNDFSIPFMLPKRVQQMSSSSQTKYTIDSLLDEPVSFSQQLKVSNFQQYANGIKDINQHQPNKSNNEEENGGHIYQHYNHHQNLQKQNE